ncbi:hypothetical protein OFM95_32485, partial [Escherichia coli]|nr:hypothetical protein [Escherichia coli]
MGGKNKKTDCHVGFFISVFWCNHSVLTTIAVSEYRPSLRLNPFRHFRPLTAKDNFFRFFL